MVTQDLPPKLTTALPVTREGDGPELCRRFCRMFGRPHADTRHGPEGTRSRIPNRVRLKDGPYFCVCQCRGFAARKPVVIMRPRHRSFHAALLSSKETLQ
ncbi:MAG: hypothetical protein AAF409_11095 [Pseudomonadota bacterium]